MALMYAANEISGQRDAARRLQLTLSLSAAARGSDGGGDDAMDMSSESEAEADGEGEAEEGEGDSKLDFRMMSSIIEQALAAEAQKGGSK